MSKKRTAESWLEESDRWDEMSLEELLAVSEPEDIKFVDRRPRRAISLRVDEEVIEAAKHAAGELGLGYQTLFRMWVIDGLRRYRGEKIRARASKKAGAS